MPHNVYVIKLHPDVLRSWKFRAANPDYVTGKPCVYVGVTGLSPDLRFDNHKAGYKASGFVKKYGETLLTELYERYNPMPYDRACEMERKLAEKLRKKGYAVWQR